MTTLMVTPFAPYRDGIATYAAQELRARRSQGEQIHLVSPTPSAAHHHLPLGGVRGAAMLVNLARSYQRVVVQYSPELLLGRCRSAGQRSTVWSSMTALARLKPVELRVHEIMYQPLADNPAERRLVSLLFRLADQVTVHTEPERELLRPLLGDEAADKIVVIDHGRNFIPAVSCTTEEAKSELGLAVDEFVFLSIGFIQRHKGFDRSVEAFTAAGLPGSRLHIVGSGRVDHPEIGAYVADLTDVCASTEGVEIHNRFVSDDQFDLWLQAADAVVLPYREIWSSSVVERARLFEKPVIASDLDQLGHQLGDDGFACADIGQMAMAMEKVWSASPHSAVHQMAPPADSHGEGHPLRRASDGVGRAQAWEVDDQDPDRASIQAQISARAGRRHVGSPTFDAPDPAAVRPGGSGGVVNSQSGGSGPSRRLAALGSLSRPEPVSARPGVAPVKLAIQRATAWQVDPMYHRICELQQATLDAVVEMEARLEAMAADSPEPDTAAESSDSRR